MSRMTYFWCGNTGYEQILSKEIDILNRQSKNLTTLLCAAGVVIYFQHKAIKSLKSRVTELEKKMKEKSEDE